MPFCFVQSRLFDSVIAEFKDFLDIFTTFFEINESFFLEVLISFPLIRELEKTQRIEK